MHYLPNGWQAFETLEQENSPGEEFVIVHAGTFYPDFKPYALFDALAMWKDGKAQEGVPPFQGIRVKLLGCNDHVTKKYIADRNLADIVTIEPWLPLDEARKIMMGADALWVTLGTGEEAATYVPSKLFEYIAADRPILGFFPDGEAADIIKNTGTGVVFHTDDSSPVIATLAAAFAGKQAGQMYPDFYQRKESVISELNADTLSQRFHGLLESLT